MKDTYDTHGLVELLFDELPDVVFFIKDCSGRYRGVNQTLADRCAGGDKKLLLGKLPAEVFPAALAAGYTRQDEQVLTTGRAVRDQLELHIYPRSRAGWCLTTKHALRDDRGRVTGVVGISRDLNAPSDKAVGFAELATALRHMRRCFATSLRIEDIAKAAGMSVHLLEQKVRRLFQMSPLQLLHKMRLDEAIRQLQETDKSLGEIALETGWCDQSAFTRHFSRYTGMAPGRFRAFEAARATKKVGAP